MPTSAASRRSTKLSPMRFRSCLAASGFIFFLGGCAASSSSGGGGTADALVGPDGEIIDSGPAAPDLVKNLSINQITFLQGTTIVLMKDGAAPTDNKTALAARRAG